jgi:hypothetical protein
VLGDGNSVFLGIVVLCEGYYHLIVETLLGTQYQHVTQTRALLLYLCGCFGGCEALEFGTFGLLLLGEELTGCTDEIVKGFVGLFVGLHG